MKSDIKLFEEKKVRTIMVSKKCTVLFIIIFAISGVYAQQVYTNEKIAISLYGAYHKNLSSGLALMYVPDYQEGCTGYSFWGVFVGSDIVFDKETPFFAPKIGWQIAAMLLCLRVSEINYIHSHGTDVRLLPEIGFDIVSYFDICYGYNIHIAGNKYNEMSSHRITLTANLFIVDKIKKKRKSFRNNL